MQYKKDQAAQAQQNWEKEYALSKQASSRSGGYSGGSGYSSINLSDGSNENFSVNTGSASGSVLGNLTSYRGNDGLGNSSSTQNKPDYYFKNENGPDYQPRYINNTKLAKTGKTIASLEKNAKMNFNLGIKDTKNIWQAGNKYYVWAGDRYVDVTSYYNKYK